MSIVEADYLLLSGIQHFLFCRRQWALMYLEGLWQDNAQTSEGRIQHERCHDEEQKETGQDGWSICNLPVVSHTMQVKGRTDVVEFRAASAGAVVYGHEGFWQPYPVEYKHGRPKSGQEDIFQLCAEAICLEEMLCCKIPQGALFYHQTRHREEVMLTDALKAEVRKTFAEMHALAERQWTPRGKLQKGCQLCSLRDLCLPQLGSHPSVAAYYQKHWESMEK